MTQSTSSGSAAPSNTAGQLRPRRGSTRTGVVMTIGVAAALLLAFIVFNLDPEASDATTKVGDDSVEELVTPPPFNAASDRPVVADLEHDPPMIEVPTGGFIEVAGNDGSVAQRYRFDHLDPAPEGMGPGWFDMTNPTVQLLNGDSVIIMRAASALLYAPNRAIESGTLQDDVVVEVFDAPDSGSPQDNEPTMVVRTDEASYDHFLGEIRCDGQVTMTAAEGELPGRGLRVLIDDEHRQRYSMHLESVDYLLLRAPAESLDAPQPASTNETTTPETRRPRRSAETRQPTATPDAQWYRVTFHNDVRIQHGPTGQSQRATGESLNITFSSAHESIQSGFAWNKRTDTNAQALTWMAPLTREQALAASALGAVQDADDFLPTSVPQPAAGETMITCSGPLTIDPIDSPSTGLGDQEDDIVIELQGAPATLLDEVEGSDATSGLVRFGVNEERVELLRREQHGVSLRTAQVAIGADHLWLSNAEQRAGVVGAGWMQPRQDTQDAAGPPADGGEPPLIDMRISWQEGVELKFLDAPDDAGTTQLERAAFRGNVTVDADRGSIAANVLDLEFRPNEAGESVPARMIATTNVKVKDQDVTLWADDLLVTLREASDSLDAATDLPSEAGDMMSFGDNIEIDTIVATQNVQILLADGSRAFAEQFNADAANEHAVLSGENVTVISNRMIVDRGTRMELKRTGQEGVITVPGPGQAVILSRDIDVSADQRIERPIIDFEQNPRQVKVLWQEQMNYDGAFADAAGALEFQGEVDAIVEPNAHEEQTMAGDFLRLEFMKQQDAADAPAADALLGQGDLTSSRALHRMIVRDGGIESRVWPDADRVNSQPSLFSINGAEITFDNLTQEASVIGVGRLLILDPGDADDPVNYAETALGGEGTTLFTWTESLQLTPLLDNEYKVTFAGDVRLLHESLNEERSTLSASTLQAELARPVAEERAVNAELDFGGSADLRRVIGNGNVLIRSPRYTIETDYFDYNVGLSQAQIVAEPGRTASIVDRNGTGTPVFVRAAVWNMQTNAIQLTDVGGG